MTLPVLGISQAMGEQTRRQSHAVCDADSDESPAEIGPHGTAFQTQGGGDLLVLLPGKDQFDNPGLPWREAKRADQFTALVRCQRRRNYRDGLFCGRGCKLTAHHRPPIKRASNRVRALNARQMP